MDRLQLILNMLQIMEMGQGQYIDFAKGKYKTPNTIKEIYNVHKRNFKNGTRRDTKVKG